ncbi:MAG TPA: MBL fold metallo-hydrolase [Burkholderiales bacterium]|nr:MBL fold metallo-hydrolase [Burkholderiales bacterium]
MTEPQPRFQTLALGQVGYRFQFARSVVYVDPYLSDYVERVEGPDLRRLFPVPFAPEAVRDGDWVLITHAHIDHCDPMTVVPIAKASPRCRFVGPGPVLAVLRQQGIDEARLRPASETEWLALGDALQVIAVPAAHPTISRNGGGCAHCVGYVIEYRGRRIYHAGDTSLADELLASLKELAPIEIAFLPVNERNYFRERRGIIGNMTLREAFGLADEVGIRTVVPVHWDMFAPNCVPRQEIELAYELLKPAFEMKIYPAEL